MVLHLIEIKLRLAILRGNRKILHPVLSSRLPSHPCVSFHFPYTEDSLEENTYLISTYRIAWKNSLFCCQNWFTLGIPLINYYSFLLVPVTVFSYIKYFEWKKLPFLVSRETRMQEQFEWRVSVYIMTRCHPRGNGLWLKKWDLGNKLLCLVLYRNVQSRSGLKASHSWIRLSG